MPPKKKPEEPLSPSEILLGITKRLRHVATKPDINSYVPHEKQLMFHTNRARGRLYSGGNRGGKTVGGTCETVWRLTGKHPYLDVPKPPVEGRVVSVDFKSGINRIIIPQLQQWIPPSELINGSWEDSYSNSDHVLRLENGSTLEMKSHDQELDTQGGIPLDFVWFDEEPPHGHFEESLMRLIDRNGVFYLTMTPVEHMTWTYEGLYQRALEGKFDLEIIEVDTSENPYIEKKSMEGIMDYLEDVDRQARQGGKFIPSSGLIFDNFDYKRHTFEELPFHLRRPDIRIVMSLDGGINHPTAVLWHAITLDGRVYTFHEIIVSNHTISSIVKLIKEFEQANRIKPYMRVADSALGQRNQQTGYSDQVAYAQLGVPLLMASKKAKPYDTLDKMYDYLDKDMWLIHKSCTVMLSQMRKYRWEEHVSRKARDKNAPKQVPHKKDDDGPDSARYMFQTLPELSKKAEIVGRADRVNSKVQSLLQPARYPKYVDQDPFFQLAERQRRQSEQANFYDDENWIV